MFELSEDEIEVALDVAGLPPQNKVTELVTGIAAGIVVILYSATELMEEIRRWRTQRTFKGPSL